MSTKSRVYLLELMPKKAQPLNKERTLVIMQYELGAIARSTVYASHASKRFPPDEIEVTGFMVSARADMTDLITQCRVYCEQCGWNFDELIVEGEIRFLERMQEVREDII